MNLKLKIGFPSEIKEKTLYFSVSDYLNDGSEVTEWGRDYKKVGRIFVPKFGE